MSVPKKNVGTPPKNTKLYIVAYNFGYSFITGFSFDVYKIWVLVRALFYIQLYLMKNSKIKKANKSSEEGYRLMWEFKNEHQNFWSQIFLQANQIGFFQNEFSHKYPYHLHLTLLVGEWGQDGVHSVPIV